MLTVVQYFSLPWLCFGDGDRDKKVDPGLWVFVSQLISFSEIKYTKTFRVSDIFMLKAFSSTKDHWIGFS